MSSLHQTEKTNIVWHDHKVKREDRIKIFNHKNKVLWFTGLSGSGKSTLATDVEKELHKKGLPTYVLDGDNIRHGLNKNLSFSPEDREENIRRVGEVAKLFYDAGVTIIVSFISPYRKERDFARKIIGEDFVEIFVKCEISECEKRDPKGLYKKAREGLIKDFTGINAPYEKPLNPEIIVDTTNKTVEESVDFVLDKI